MPQSALASVTVSPTSCPQCERFWNGEYSIWDVRIEYSVLFFPNIWMFIWLKYFTRLYIGF